MFGGVRGSPGGVCRGRREVYMSHRQAERGNGTGETQNGHRRQGSRKLNGVCQWHEEYWTRARSKAEGFHSLIGHSGVARQCIASPAGSSVVLAFINPVVFRRAQGPKWPAAGPHARRPNRANPVSHTGVLLELRAYR